MIGAVALLDQWKSGMIPWARRIGMNFMILLLTAPLWPTTPVVMEIEKLFKSRRDCVPGGSPYNAGILLSLSFAEDEDCKQS